MTDNGGAPPLDRASSLRTMTLALAGVWTAVMVVSLGWSLYQLDRAVRATAQAETRGAFNKDLVYRRWAAFHGGVYVPATEKTPSSPYLAHIPERDLTTPSGRKLTLVNPAYMTRQVHELGREQYGLAGHITSLNPIRLANAPDPWERAALTAFERGQVEVSSIETLDGEPHMRLMQRMVVEESCLKCHAAQGYKVGDIRGGVSVSAPMAPYEAIVSASRRTIAAGHAAIWALGLLGLGLGERCIRRGLCERDRAEAEVRQYREGLEVLVAQRTTELETANGQLQQELEQRQRAEEALTQAANEWQETFDAVDAYIAVIDADRTVVRVNRALREAFPDQEIVGTPCYGLIHGTAQRPAGCPSCATLATGEIVHSELQEPHLGNRWFDVSSFPVRDAAGTVTRVVHILRDITERRRRNEENARLLAIMNESPDFIGVADLQGNLKYHNPAAKKMVGLPEDADLCAMRIMDMHPAWAGRLVQEEGIPTALRQRTWRSENALLHRNGSEIPVSQILVLHRDSSGKPAFISTTMRDLTADKRAEAKRTNLERQLQEKQKLAATGSLARGMAHEINNLIMGIMNYAQLIKDSLQGKDEALEEFAGEIIIEGERVASIIRDLSAFASRDIVSRAPAPVSDLVESALTPMRATLTQDQITLEVDLSDNLPAVACDRRQIERVLMGLISNAHDALNAKYEGGHRDKKIIITARVLCNAPGGSAACHGVTEGEDGASTTAARSGAAAEDIGPPEPSGADSGIRITVEDHGAGIVPELREHIFEPFFTTKDKSVGAGSVGKGLGLFTSYAFVREHGGQLSVESDPGNWARFHVDLPAVAGDEG